MQAPLPDFARAAKTEKGARCITLTVPLTHRGNGNGFRALGAGLPRTEEVVEVLACKAEAVDTESDSLLAPSWDGWPNEKCGAEIASSTESVGQRHRSAAKPPCGCSVLGPTGR